MDESGDIFAKWNEANVNLTMGCKGKKTTNQSQGQGEGKMGWSRSWGTDLYVGNLQRSGDVKCNLSILVDMAVFDENLPGE